MTRDVVEGDFHCPRCGGKMFEKHPNDKKLIREMIRFSCPCGYYYDISTEELISRGKKII